MKPPHTRSHAAAVFWVIASLLACTLLTPAAPASPPSPSTPPEAVSTEPPTSTGVQLNAPTPSPSPSSRAWQPAGFGGAGNFLSVHFDPNQPGVVYAASDVSGVMRSTDYGDHWEIRSVGLGNYEIASFAVDPFDSDTLYAGVGADRESNRAGIYVSHDAGLTWEHLDNTAENHITFRRFRTNDAIALDPANQGVIISGSRENGIWRSTDGGQTWEQVYEAASTGASLAGVENLVPDDPTESPHPAPVSVVAFDSANPNVVYAGLLGVGVIESMEGGVAGSWQPINNGLPNAAAVTYLAVGDGVLYATLGADGVYRSDDGGESWEAANGNLPALDERTWVSSVTVHPTDPNIAYISLATFDYANVWKTTDGGATWVEKGEVTVDPVNNPTEAWNTTTSDGTQWPYTMSWQVTLDPREPNRLFYVNFWDIIRSDDGGEHWATKIAGAQNTCVTDLAVDGDILYATHWDAGLLASNDQGGSWTPILPSTYNDPALAGHFWRVVVAGAGEANYYFATSDPWNTDYGQVLRSEDGVNWTSAFQNTRPAGTWLGGMMLGLAVDPSQPSTLYVTQDGGDVFKSTDNGDSWSATNGQPGGNSFTYALAVDEAGRVFAGTISDGLWRSVDGGDSWGQVVNEQSTIFHALAVPGAVYASAGDGNLYRSTDGGDSWQRLTDFASEDDGDGVGQQGMAIAVGPNDLDHIFFSRLDTWHSADAGSGVVESTDGGWAWSPLNDGLGLLKVSVMAMSADGTLFAGTSCGGVWRLRMRP